MFHYQLKKDCLNIAAKNDSEFFEKLWKQTPFSPARSVLEFKHELADALFNLYGVDIQSIASRQFVTELVNAGYLIKSYFPD